jgi:hypothetical protein
MNSTKRANVASSTSGIDAGLSCNSCIQFFARAESAGDILDARDLSTAKMLKADLKLEKPSTKCFISHLSDTKHTTQNFSKSSSDVNVCCQSLWNVADEEKKETSLAIRSTTLCGCFVFRADSNRGSSFPVVSYSPNALSFRDRCLKRA